MSILRPLSLLCIVLSIGACRSDPPHADPAPPSEPAMRPVGGDRDTHGCLPSAGYSWCARENACMRPWELAEQKGFANTAEAFAAYCAASTTK